MLAGQINFMCTATGSFLPLVHAGQIKAYAVTAPKRIVEYDYLGHDLPGHHVERELEEFASELG